MIAEASVDPSKCEYVIVAGVQVHGPLGQSFQGPQGQDFFWPGLEVYILATAAYCCRALQQSCSRATVPHPTFSRPSLQSYDRTKADLSN
jgi:hypothetical protein